MGCDIHALVECKTKDGRWISCGAVDIWRNYDLFALLGDVRNSGDVKPLSRRRGVPPDASGGYRDLVEMWGADGHSHSWLTLAELKKCKRGKSIIQLPAIIGRMEYEDMRVSKPGTEIRLVFFFDN